ncbi:DNA polymerase epsilon subunit 2 [Daktulosphaira vitifoliae]|uniref:DNA polymerase epsilon subunit 2 n=1 Tax=Daktulosphaira vitifoliae TaxID=58002 RepID=UPI0021AA622C|nr:DNA polymerase epsilon subunit 2 [Daktulosphaira vitifoliae]
MSDNLIKLRKRIISTFSLNGFAIQEQACGHLVKQLEPLCNDRERDIWLDKIVDYVQNSIHENTSTLVNFELLVKALKFCCDSEVLNTQDTLAVRDCIKNFNFRYRYCPVKKKFFKDITDNSQLSLFGDAQAKIQQFLDRYTIVRQRMLRVQTAKGNSNGNNAGGQTIADRLRDVDYLLSCGSAVRQSGYKSSNSPGSIILLGMISQLKEGRYYLEDPTGAIKIDLTNTDFHNGYFTENCCVLAEGLYDEIDCIFKVSDMALPPGEKAEISRIYFGDCTDDEIFIKSNSSTLRAYEEQKKRMIVFVSDIHLDNAKVLSKLKILLRGFNDHAPAAIVMMGDFLSASAIPGSQYSNELQSHFNNLAEWIVANCERIVRDTTLVVLPGPNDRHCANILPKLAFPEFLTQKFRQLLPKTVFTSNPTHMRYCTQRLCIVRADLITKTVRNALNLKLQKNMLNVNTSTQNVANNYVKTLKSQSHLVSLPADICPVYWTRAQALSLYPMPDLVCVADGDSPPFCINPDENSQRSGCVFINSSSFSKRQYSFIVYMTAERKADESQIPLDSVDVDDEYGH